MSDRLHQYRRALKEPFRYDVAFYAGLYIEELEAEVERLRDREKRGKLRMLVSCLRARVRELEAETQYLPDSVLLRRLDEARAAVSAEREADSE